MGKTASRVTPSRRALMSGQLEQRILLVRGDKVMLDADLALLYGVRTKALNQAVKRNRQRFPRDFMFRLSRWEKAEVVTNCDHLYRLKFSSTLPYAFTEHGALMLASVLNSPRAIEVSIYVVRAFVRLRQLLATHRDLAAKLAALERKLQRHDAEIRSLFDAIKQLMTPPEPPRRRVGFHP